MALRSVVEDGISDELDTIDVNNRSCCCNVSDSDFAIKTLGNLHVDNTLYGGRMIARYK